LILSVDSIRFYLPSESVILLTSTEQNNITCKKQCREELTMKTIKSAAIAVALSALSFGVFAAQPVTPAQAQGMQKVGTVSAYGATTLDGMEAQLAEKAAAAGATGYSITSATNNNKISGTAVIYK